MTNTSFWLRVALGSAVVAVLGFAIYRAISRLKWSTTSWCFFSPTLPPIHKDQTIQDQIQNQRSLNLVCVILLFTLKAHRKFFISLPFLRIWLLDFVLPSESVDRNTPRAIGSYWSYYSPHCFAQLFLPYIVQPGWLGISLSALSALIHEGQFMSKRCFIRGEETWEDSCVSSIAPINYMLCFDGEIGEFFYTCRFSEAYIRKMPN